MPQSVSLASLLSKPRQVTKFHVWLVGDTPLITHAWSEKAKREMLSKQVKAVKVGKEARDPQDDYLCSLYEIREGVYGFPATAVKNCIVSAAHKDKGIARTDAKAALWLDANMVRTRPALAGAVCDMPLLRIWGSGPEMREDMVRIGAGLNKTATLAYRAQFTHWAFRLTGSVTTTILPLESLQFLLYESGTTTGIGEWRNEKNGLFGAFHPADVQESAEWERFSRGQGPMPISSAYQQDEAA